MWTLLKLTELFVGVMAILLIGRYWSWPGSRRKDMPPGPTPLPILENVLQMKPLDIYAQFQDLNNKYGPLVSLKVGVGNMIVIGGDGSLVRHLLDKRGAIYSNRPLQMSTEIAGKGDGLLLTLDVHHGTGRFQQDSSKWRLARKQIVQHYASSVVKTEYVGLQEAESVQLLHDFLHDPKHFMQHPMRFTTSVVTCLNYGVRCETYEDPAVRTIEEIMVRVCDLLMPGSKPPVEDFPWLRFIPDFVSDWKARSRNIGDLMDKLYGDLADIAWTRGASGLNRGTLSYKLRANEANSGLSRHFQAYIAGLVLEGGSGIVAGVILTCILILIKDTSSQERARKEIDALYDEDTLPRWVDEQAMPFVRAVIKEVLRWRPSLPIAIPHRLEQDDYYEGYFHPKDSTVICNIWAIHSNPGRFDDPKVFRPERFLDYKMSMAESIAQGDPFERDHFAFGAGRRSCPGVQVAEQDVFIALSRLLWAFEFSAPTGTQVNVEQSAFTGETVRHPKEFPLVIKPRSERRKATIEREMAHAKEHVFSQYGVYKPE
ncbi:cytochrome P450 family protein [Rhizoctonia solani]|uniref:Cytochrome P450 family protein n=1 Tax=Rhizoctonia solani TaxID=456999 RepID=A0A8H8SSD4_9AGAM|nr:cytochrome P450 family protein [Rhizoctonia solani]QRW15884.1 cytochrome P450 family protein [Rhizoctonia solani]